MLTLVVSGRELWNEKTEEFIPETKDKVLTLEHSLVSVSKWESKWCIPYISKTPKTREQSIDYIRCMTLTQNVDPETYTRISNADIRKVQNYIDLPMTATFFGDQKKTNPGHRVVTSELIYYWMIVNNIPFECQKWHLNRLLTLIRVSNVENDPKKKKIPMNERLQTNAEINAARRKAWNTSG